MGRVRQADIARVAGVSQATVSVVLGGNRTGVRLSERTRLRVLEAAEQLGYVPDPVTSARNDLFGICTGTPAFEAHQPILAGVEAEAAALGKDLIMFTAPGPAPLRRTRLADGCLFLGGPAPAELIATGFPIVHIGSHPGFGGVAHVDADLTAATAEVLTRLARAGHRCVRYLGEPAGSAEPVRAAADRAGVVLDTGDAAPDPAALRRWLGQGVTALVVAESVADTALRALGEAGISVPGEVSLAVLGRPPRGTPGPELSGFDLPRRAIGREAVRLLAELLDTGAAGHRLLPCPPVAGETIAPVA